MERENFAANNRFLIITGEEGSRWDDTPSSAKTEGDSKETLCSECEKPVGLSDCTFDPVECTLKHTHTCIQ